MGKSIEEKIEGYKKFWRREKVKRPLIGYDIGGYHPLKRFKALRKLRGKYLLPDFLNVSDYLDDYRHFYQQSIEVNDDLIKGVTPIPALPWMEAMLGCPIMVSGETIWAEERKASWEELHDLSLTDDNGWLIKYLEFLAKLSEDAKGEYPVGTSVLRGVTDLIGVLRGYSEALIDCMERPDKVKALANRCTEAIMKANNKQYEVIKPFHGGYFIEQFSVWAPDKIVRMQNDATGVYSPHLYKDLIQEFDQMIASSFPYALIHLHPTSFFLLDSFLEIEEINLFEMNKDVGGLSTEEMIPYLKKVQDKDRCLLIRGQLTENDLELIKKSLSPVGLCLQIVKENSAEAKEHLKIVEKVFSVDY